MSENKKSTMDEAKAKDKKTRQQDYAVVLLGLTLVFLAKIIA